MAYKNSESTQRMILREKKGKRPLKIDRNKEPIEMPFQKKKSYHTKPKNHRKIESVRERRKFNSE